MKLLIAEDQSILRDAMAKLLLMEELVILNARLKVMLMHTY